MRRRNRPLVFLASALRLTLTLAVAAQPVLAATVAAALCGDVNGDGVVDIGDALVVAEFDVGDRQCSQLTHPEACDVNGDGACNIDDALRIAQCDVGLISCGFTCGPFTCPSTTSTTTTTRRGTCSGACPIHTVFLILMENHNWSSIKGSPSAPYVNDTLLPIASHAEQHYNPTNLHPSEPNYLWLEAGTNFGILNDDDPSSNHQSTSRHLVDLLEAAGLSWRAYQEDISGTDCPLTDVGLYHVHHDPFVYFDDVTQGNNPQAARCIEHVRPYSELQTDLINDPVARYNFITPDVCNDMHDACAPLNDPVQQGDTWLSTEVPKILTSPAYANNGVLFILWDEGGTGDGPIGMIVLSPKAKGGGYSNTIVYHHSSTLRTMQEIFNVTTPMLGGAADATNAFDLRDLLVKIGSASCRE